MVKIIRTATIAMSLDLLLKGQLKFLNTNFDTIALSGEDEHLKTVRNREGVKTLNVSMERKISPIKDLISLYRLTRIFIREQPLIVHSITPKAGLLTMIAGKIARVPIRIHTFTGLIFPTKKGIVKKLLILMDQLLCWAATEVYPEGEGVKTDLVRYKVTEKQLKVLSNGNVNGIDLRYFSDDNVGQKERFLLKSKLNISDSDFLFVFVGRLVGDKGVNELVEAFSELKIASVKLLLVGPFEYELDPLNPATIEQIKVNKNILSVGFQSDIRPYLSISNVLVFPSYREGFPNVVLQAGAMGLPSIVTNINGSNEIITEGINGTIIPVQNSGMLMDAMHKMAIDKIYFKKLAEQARAVIASRYEQSLVWNALLTEYNTLIAAVYREEKNVS